MARIDKISSDNITVKERVDARVVKGTSYEGLPVASNTENGIIMYDNVTIKKNVDGKLYCTLQTGNGDGTYDDFELTQHIQNQSIHLSQSQTSTLISAESHMSNDDKHVSSTDKTNIGKINAHILDKNVHVSQSQITNIESSYNHTTNNSAHLSVSDRDNLSLAVTHSKDSSSHITDDEKGKINSLDLYVNNDVRSHLFDSSLHLSSYDRDDINSVISKTSAFEEHLNSYTLHFDPDEKELMTTNIVDNAIAIRSLEETLATTSETVNDMALKKLDSNNHSSNKILITDSYGNVVYHPTVTPNTLNIQSDWNSTSGDSFIKNKPTSMPANGGDCDTIGGKKIYVQQSAPTGVKTGDVWISW